MFERIVLAVDGSEPARRAVPVAADIASKYGSEVIAVHVMEKQIGRVLRTMSGQNAFRATAEPIRAAAAPASSGVAARSDRAVRSP